MNTVGPDKRTQYYRLSPEAVLKILKSHQMGLTNSEASRRQIEQGANILPARRMSTTTYVLQSAGHPFVAATALATLLASTIGQTGLALLLAVLTVSHVVLRYSFFRSRLSVGLGTMLPAHAKVTRNDQTRGLETAKLVVGDIVYVETGDTIPADLRILEEHNLVANDAAIFGGNVHTRKFAHTILQAVPLIARNNLLRAGSTIVQGTARGVVIAIGTQTELGRIAVLHQTAVANKLARQTRDPGSYVFALSVVLAAAALLFLGWQSGSENIDVLTALLFLAVGVVPNGSGLSRWLMSNLASRRLSIQGSMLAALGSVDLAIIDTTEASKNMVVASSLAVGRAVYTIEATGYEPVGRILDSNGKALAHKQLAELKLLFEACTYTNSAAVLRPDSHHKAWHARGNLYEVAALVLARSAGFNTEQLQAKHEVLHAFPYDAGRQMASSVRRYGSDVVVFVRGNPAAVLERCKKLWDHGHVRTLSAGDKAYFTKQTPAVKGKAYMAFAYRILPDKADPAALNIDAAEQDLTFLGAVTMEHASETESVVAATRTAGFTTATLTAETHLGSISSTSLRKLTDAELTKLLRNDSSFSRLTVEDILRLVSVAQHAGHKIAVLGNNLVSLPARTQAEAGFTLAGNYNAKTDNIHDATELTTVLDACRGLLAKLANVRHVAIIQSMAFAVAALFSAIGLFYYHVPLAISLGAVLAIQLIVFPLAAFALPPAKVRQVVTKEFTAAGVVLGILAYGGFLYSFSLHSVSPDFISPTSRFALASATVAAVIVSLALLAEVMLTHYQTKTTFSVWPMAYWGVAALLIICMVYSSWLQSLLGTNGLDPADWLTVCGAAAVYAGFRLFQHHTRHHTRRAVVALHHKTFGKSSSAHV